MDVRIGIADSPQILEVDLPDETNRDALREHVGKVLSGDESVLVIEDRRGKEINVPAARVSFIEIGAADSERRIGFGA